MKESSLSEDTNRIVPVWLAPVLNYASSLLGDTNAVQSLPKSLSMENIGTGKGFINQILRIRIDDSEKSRGVPESVILKLPSKDPSLVSLSGKLGNREREARFYSDVADQANIHTPAIYFNGVDTLTGYPVLVMEDMGNYRQGDSVKGCSLYDATSAIVELANFHSYWWDNERLHALDWVPARDSETDIYLEIYPEAWRIFLEKSGDNITGYLKAIGDKLPEQIPHIKNKLAHPPLTLLHGDYRLDNCFLGDSERYSSIAIFDWEYCAKGRGVFDVATFICEAFPPEERRANEMALLGIYFDTLIENGVLGYSMDQCILDYRLAMLDVFVFWVVTGGYCDFKDDRGSVFLENALQRFDAAIKDLECEELLPDFLV